MEFCIKNMRVIVGDGAAILKIKGNYAATDATAYRTAMYALDPATDTEYEVAQVVPDGANPKFTILAPDDVPTTSELDADNITFRYIKATDTLNVYVNEGGVIKTYAIGVLV